MPRLNFIPAVVLYSLAFLHWTAIAQEYPKFTPTILEPNTTNRQYVCDRHNNYYSGKVQLRDALQGFELHALFNLYDERLFKLTDERLDPEDPGVMVTIMDELARRAGFIWRNSFAVVDLSNGVGKNNTWTDLLDWGVESFDIHCDWWSTQVERLELGIGFPEGFYDASFTLAGMKPELSTGNTNLFNWLEPFEPIVWWTILATILVSTVFYILLERLNNWNKIEDRVSLSQGLFLSSLVFTQHFQFTPKSHAARLFATSFAFWSLIIISTYTANLASFFIVQNTPQLQINTIDDAIRANMRICVWEGTSTDTYLSVNYPNGNYVRKEKEEETFLAVKEEECELVMTYVQSWIQFENNRDVNEDCNLALIGRVIKFVDAGFALKNDGAVHCTSLIQDVLNIHLVEMQVEGFIEKTWEDSYRKNQDINCNDRLGSSQGDDHSVQLSMYDMAGTFFINLLAAIIALILTGMKAFHTKYVTPKNRREHEDLDPVNIDPNKYTNHGGHDSYPVDMDTTEVDSEIPHDSNVHALVRRCLNKEMKKMQTELQELRKDLSAQKELSSKILAIGEELLQEKH